jgi:hypothetical protein
VASPHPTPSRRTSRGADLRAEAGDWELIDPDGDRWTVAADTFTRSYQRSPDGHYRKRELIDAVQLTGRAEISPLEGAATTEIGDRLLRDAVGAVWPVPDRTFRARYRPA